jgi:hypothetical protein
LNNNMTALFPALLPQLDSLAGTPWKFSRHPKTQDENELAKNAITDGLAMLEFVSGKMDPKATPNG